MWAGWLIVAGICFVIEIYTIGFFVFWFGIGALITMLSSFFISSIYIQTMIFVISSSLLLLFTKPLCKRFIKDDQTTSTNVYSIIGKDALVIENIDNITGEGKIKVNGEIWSAISDTNIEKDTKVKVLSINGVKAKVEKI